MSQPIIIGLGHYSRTGKDTFANALLQSLYRFNPELRVARKSFATKLKEITHELYGWAGLGNEAYYNDPAHEHERDVVLPVLGKTPVEVWVDFGTKAVRNQVYSGTWVDYLLKTDFDLDVMVISDVRFPNEMEAIHQVGGHLIKIVRNGYGPKMTVADLALIHCTSWDNVIGDRPEGVDGIENLKQWADQYAQHIVQGQGLHLLQREPVEIQAALAVQELPDKAAIQRIFAQAGLTSTENAA